jgi:CDP-paratose synthetase
MKKKYKILITGGTGFLGSNLVNELCKNDKLKIFILCRLSSNFTRIDKKNLKKVVLLKIENINLNKIFQKYKFDSLIHCATNYGLKKKNISDVIQPNLILPMQLLDLAKNYKIKAFINTDSILKKNISNYSLSKHHFSEWLKLFSKDFYCCNIKIEHFFGAQDDDTKFVISIIKSFLNKSNTIKLTEGNQKRDFIYIDDVISAIKKILIHSQKQKKGFEVFEVGTGKNISIKEVVMLIKKLCKNMTTKLEFGKIPMRKNEPLDVKLNLKKLFKLKWKPKYNLEESLKKTIRYYKQ